MRFLRDYVLTITSDEGQFKITPPLRVAFECDKSISGGLNKLILKVYNLKESNRSLITRDKEESTKLINIQLDVGYQDEGVETIFKGQIFFGTNEREGPNFVSFMECLDGGFDYQNSFSSITAKTKEDATNLLVKDMPNTTRGAITDLDAIFRPKVMVGNTYALIQNLVPKDAEFYIDNGQIFIIKDAEVISRFIPKVSARTGLINTPERQNQKVTFTTLMNPELKLGSLCDLNSAIDPRLNGIYKIETITYSGDYDGTEWTQTCTGFLNSNFEVVSYA